MYYPHNIHKPSPKALPPITVNAMSDDITRSLLNRLSAEARREALKRVADSILPTLEVGPWTLKP